MKPSSLFNAFLLTTAFQYVTAERRIHRTLSRITCPNHTHTACQGQNVCLNPCSRHFLPTQNPAFFYENLPEQDDARLWIEVLPSTEAKKIFIDEIGYAKPLYTTELSPGTSGRIEVGPIPEPGSYNVILFKDERTFAGVKSVQKFCISKF